MSINPDAVGVSSNSERRSWSARDSLLYALGVGAGQADPVGFELQFTTDNTEGVPQQVLPTFACVVGGPLAMPSEVGSFDHAMLLHGEEQITLFGPIPAAGSIDKQMRIVGIHDKGSGALVVSETESRDVATGRPLFTVKRGAFIRGAGGWGRRPSSPAVVEPAPQRPPDGVLRCPTRADQALLYRLSGDVNPLHSDPAFALRAGFQRPILHGLCTFGVSGLALLHSVCGSEPSRVISMRGRFVQTVEPGETLIVSVWIEGELVWFRTETESGARVLDRGRLDLDRTADTTSITA